MYIVSACLLGQNCKYNGGNNRNEDVVEFCRTHKYVTVCPESAGRLPSPRPPAEKVGSKIMDKNGGGSITSSIFSASINLHMPVNVPAYVNHFL